MGNEKVGSEGSFTIPSGASESFPRYAKVRRSKSEIGESSGVNKEKTYDDQIMIPDENNGLWRQGSKSVVGIIETREISGSSRVKASAPIQVPVCEEDKQDCNYNMGGLESFRTCSRYFLW